MRGYVVDASAAASVLFREPGGASVAEVLLDAAAMFVPQLFHLEVASVGRSKVLRGELHAGGVEALLEEMEGWPLRVVSVTWRDALRVAMRHDLTLYDAAYLHLTLARNVPLVTLDSDLHRAAGRKAAT